MGQSRVGLCALFAVLFCGTFIANASPLGEQHLVGAKHCTWGPSYWCKNITNAKNCNAVTHCIQTTWQTMHVPVDNGSICQICKDMVAQARDQLRSNETMEELKEVFEGSCNLIPMKVVKKECCKLADDFIPELVEALCSQMNPDQVCSVAGLCNNAEIDNLLKKYYTAALDGTLPEETEEKTEVEIAPKSIKLSCGNCDELSSMLSTKFLSIDRDEVLDNILHLCGQMSSFSDACANIALTYFNDIYDHVKSNGELSGACHMSGVCSWKYHQHAGDDKEENAMSMAAAMQLKGGDDIPCELCEQLVNHLRDVLVANTTEAEFKQVLEGLCSQSRGFKTECLSIVDQYYDLIYKYLVNGLNANETCFMMGVCPKGDAAIYSGDVRPLLPSFPPAEIKVTLRKKLGASEPKFTQEELHDMTLPIDNLMGAANPSLLVENGQLCTLCEYMLHFIQETLATPATADEIKKEVSGICNKMPNSVRAECHNFIDMYGDAVIALLIQGLDPREVCPKIQMCPANQENHDDMEVFNPIPYDPTETDKPTCPLCLFAVQQAQEKIKNDKSKENIKRVLKNLCIHLPSKLQHECNDFVETYTNELVDMLITDFKPQEICVALQLCPKNSHYLEDMGLSVEEEITDFNVEDSSENSALNEVNSEEWPVEIAFDQDEATPNCLLCVEIVKMAEKQFKKNASKEDIKRALQHTCDKLRKSLQKKCHKIMDKYSDRLADLLLKEAAPKIVCRALGMCLWSEKEDLEIDEAMKYDVIVMPAEGTETAVSEPPNCVLCEFLMTKLEMELKNKKTQDEIKHTILSICKHMPRTIKNQCNSFVQQYASAILALLGTMPPKQICQSLTLCAKVELDTALTDEVKECGICHGATMALLPYFKQHLDTSKISKRDIVEAACEDLPAKYYDPCIEMVKIYGLSILQLSEKENADHATICAEIGKCYGDEESSLAFARISA